jgi:preprotein translocase subunit YajC
MLISKAYAQDMNAEITADAIQMADTPSAASAFMWNMGLIGVMVIMFYILLIKPQQKRFQAHKEMMDGLKVGDKVATAGGLVGRIHKLTSKTEVIVDLGNDIKVTALRHTLAEVIDGDLADKAEAEEKAKKEEKK